MLPFLLSVGLALAQAVPTPQPPGDAAGVPPQIVQPKEFTIVLSPDETNTIGDGLMELSMKKAMPLLQKIREQVSHQIAEAAKSAAPK